MRKAKRWFIAFLSVLFLLNACTPLPPATGDIPGSTPPADHTFSTEPQADPEATAPQIVPVPEEPGKDAALFFHVNVKNEEAVGKDGAILFDRTWQEISGYELLQGTIQELPAFYFPDSAQEPLDLEETLSYYDSIKEAGAAWVPLCQRNQAYFSRLDRRVISMQDVAYLHRGGIHGDRCVETYNLDRVSGKRLKLTDILMDPQAGLAILQEMVLDGLMELANGNEDAFFPEYRDHVSLRFQRENANESGWYFSEDGLKILFAEYEIAPYAAGIICVSISYESLNGVLKPEFMPQLGRRAANGQLMISPLDKIPVENVRFIDQFLVSDNGETFALTTDSEIYDLRLSTVEGEGKDIYVVRDLYAINRLKADEGLMITAQIPDTIPNLMVSYHNGTDQRQYFLITQSGKDGSMVLLPVDTDITGAYGEYNG